jgi:hypothetical protein
MTHDNDKQSIISPDTLPIRNRSRSFSDFITPNKKSLFEDEVIDTKKKTNWFVRALKAVGKPIMRGISKVINPIKSVAQWLLNTKVGKILTSKALSTAISVVSCSLGMAGIMLFGAPIAATTAFALGAAGLSSIAIKTAVESYQIRSVRRVEKESNLLISHRNNQTIQDYLLKLHPELKSALQDSLYQPNRNPDKKSITRRYNSKPQGLQSKLDSFFRSFTKNALGVGTDLLSVATSPTAGTADAIQALGGAAFGLLADGTQAITMDAIRKQYKNQIDAERNKLDTPGYNNLRELRLYEKQQEIQTEALKRLIASGSYQGMSPEQIAGKFNELKEKIRREQIEVKVLDALSKDGSYRLMSPEDQKAKFEKLVQKEIINDIDKQDTQKSQGNFFSRIGKNVISFVKDIGRPYDPYSKYNSPDELTVQTVNNFTKNAEALKTKEENNLNAQHHNKSTQDVRDLLANDPQLNDLRKILHILGETQTQSSESPKITETKRHRNNSISI